MTKPKQRDLEQVIKDVPKGKEKLFCQQIKGELVPGIIIIDKSLSDHYQIAIMSSGISIPEFVQTRIYENELATFMLTKHHDFELIEGEKQHYIPVFGKNGNITVEKFETVKI